MAKNSSKKAPPTKKVPPTKSEGKPKDVPSAFGKKKPNLGSPEGIINAQGFLDKKTLKANIKANRPNQETAFGDRQYIQNKDGSWTVKDTLSQDQQQLLGSRTGYGQAAAGLARDYLQNSAFGQGRQFSLDQLQTQRPLQGSLEDERRRIEDATFQRLTRDFGQQKAEEKDQLEQDLFNRGITPGSDAYAKAMDNYNKKWSRAETEARQAATQIGGEEFSRSFDIGSRARADEIGERQGELSFGAELAGRMFGTTPDIERPDFIGFSQVQRNAPNVMDVVGGMGQLANQRAALARSGGGGGGEAPQIPSYGGAPGAYTPPQPKGPSFGQQVGTAIVEGIANAAVNNMTTARAQQNTQAPVQAQRAQAPAQAPRQTAPAQVQRQAGRRR